MEHVLLTNEALAHSVLANHPQYTGHMMIQAKWATAAAPVHVACPQTLALAVEALNLQEVHQ
jgi:hypothetical protein